MDKTPTLNLTFSTSSGLFTVDYSPERGGKNMTKDLAYSVKRNPAFVLISELHHLI